MNISLEQLKEAMACETFGMSQEQAKNENICINCKEPIIHHPSLYVDAPTPTYEEKIKPGMIYTDAGLREYRISRLCECFFNRITNVVLTELHAH